MPSNVALGQQFMDPDEPSQYRLAKHSGFKSNQPPQALAIAVENMQAKMNNSS